MIEAYCLMLIVDSSCFFGIIKLYFEFEPCMKIGSVRRSIFRGQGGMISGVLKGIRRWNLPLQHKESTKRDVRIYSQNIFYLFVSRGRKERKGNEVDDWLLGIS